MVADSAAAASRGEAFFTRFGWVCDRTSEPVILFLLPDEANEDVPFVVATDVVERLAERRRDISPANVNRLLGDRNVRSTANIWMMSGPMRSPPFTFVASTLFGCPRLESLARQMRLEANAKQACSRNIHA